MNKKTLVMGVIGADVHAVGNQILSYAFREAGFNVINLGEPGATPLHMAAYASRPVHVQLLLEAGADPLAKTDNGRDPGSMARKVKADETAGVLSLWILKGCKAGKPC